MAQFEFGKDALSFISMLISLIALLTAIISPDIFSRYFIPMLIISFLVLFTYIINYFRREIEAHKIEIKKLNEKINIYKDISDLKVRINVLEKK